MSNVAGEDVVDAGDELGESGSVERLLGASMRPFTRRGREEANGLTGGALGVVKTAKIPDAGLKAFGVVLDAIDLGDRADALQAREGLAVPARDVLSEEPASSQPRRGTRPTRRQDIWDAG